MRPLAIDLFTGIHGWAEGLIDAGFYVVGFDIEDMSAQFGEPKPDHFSLVLQNVLTLHGSQFATADLIVASPPCQAYSWMAMPWSLAKAKAAKIRADETGAELVQLNALFNACFRIQREASEAAGRHIPMVVENVRGAIPWVGRSRGSFGSYHFWGDVPALMPSVKRYGFTEGNKRTGRTMCFPTGSANPDAVKGRTGKLGWQDASVKVPGFRFDGSGRSFQTEATKVPSVQGRRTDVGNGARFTSRDCGVEGAKAPAGTRWFNDGPRTPDSLASSGSKSPARKAASARIAKIPFALSSWIGRVYYPRVSLPQPLTNREVA